MITNRLAGRYLGHLPGRDADEESLQTDVMRFMAILGLCLTAVFALVQGLATSRQVDQQKPKPLLQQQLNRVSAQLQQSQRQLKSAQQTLAVLARQSRQQLMQIQRLKSERRPPPAEEPDRPARPQPITTEPQSETTTAVAVTRTPPAKRQPKPQIPQDAPVEQGLVLRFTSQQALRQLLQQQRITLLASAGKQAWKISINPAGSARWTAMSLPNRYHEMATETVPATYKTAFAQQIGQGREGQLTWGVVLPESMTQQIRRIIRNRESGTLLIAGDGRVTISGGV